MCVDGSWRLGPGARRRIVAQVKAGMSQKRAAAQFSVRPARPRGRRGRGRWIVARARMSHRRGSVTQTMTASAGFVSRRAGDRA